MTQHFKLIEVRNNVYCSENASDKLKECLRKEEISVLAYLIDTNPEAGDSIPENPYVRQMYFPPSGVSSKGYRLKVLYIFHPNLSEKTILIVTDDLNKKLLIKKIVKMGWKALVVIWQLLSVSS